MSCYVCTVHRLRKIEEEKSLLLHLGSAVECRSPSVQVGLGRDNDQMLPWIKAILLDTKLGTADAAAFWVYYCHIMGTAYNWVAVLEAQEKKKPSC